MKKKLLSLALTLALCLSMAVPAFAADTLNGDQLSYGDWGNGPSLTLSGVVKMTKTPIDPTEIYDVEVGGSLVLDMIYPAGKNRIYRIWNQGIYILFPPNPGDFADWENSDALDEKWDLPGATEEGYFNESSGKTRYVYNFTEADMGQKNGYDKISYPYIYWYDDADGDGVADNGSEGSAYFGVRVVPANSSATGIGFSDVPADAYYSAAVKWAVDNDITVGTSATTFSPDQYCTQEQILTFLYRAVQGEDYVVTAGDMDKAVNWAREKGMIDGSLDRRNPCTRATAVSYIWQALGKESAKASSFTDVPADAAYAKAVDWAVANGITAGTSDAMFSPNNTCTRGQIATFLHRAYVSEARLK